MWSFLNTWKKKIKFSSKRECDLIIWPLKILHARSYCSRLLLVSQRCLCVRFQGGRPLTKGAWRKSQSIGANVLGTEGIRVPVCVRVFCDVPLSLKWHRQVLCVSMGNVYAHVPKYTVIFWATFGAKSFHFYSRWVAVREKSNLLNPWFCVGGVPPLASYRSSPACFSWVVVKETLFGGLPWRGGVAA